MNGKISRIEDLLADGWNVEDIVSEHGAIEVLLGRGGARSTIVLDQQDAWDVLYGQAFAGPRTERRTVAIER